MGSFSIVGLIGKRRDPSLNPLIASLCELLQARGCEVLVERSKASSAIDPRLLVETEEIARRADLAIVVGGDGTLLGVGRTLAAAQVPILGINQGRLGFMVDIPPEGMQDAICAVLDGDHDSEERLILSATLERNGEKDRKVRTSVNDVVIRNQATIRMIEFETWMDREFISSHRADGMIISSPTGSSAYALSGGGPLLHPALSAFSLVPICPHTLSDRPIVVCGEQRIRVIVRGSQRAQAMVTFDGQLSETLDPGDVVEVTRAPYALKLIHPPGYSYFSILRNKLRWGRGPDKPAERA